MPEAEDQVKALENAETAAKRSAMVLVVATAVAISAIWLFNSTTIVNLRRRQQAEEWYFRTREALCRYKAYERQDSVFLQALTISTLRDSFARPRDLTKLDVPCSPVEELGYIGEPWQAAACFGDRAASILGKAAGSKATKADLSQAIAACFTDEDWRSAMNRPGVVESFQTVSAPSAWRGVAVWMVVDIWPPPGLFGLGGEFSGPTVYGGRLRENRVWLLERRLLHLLYDTDGKPEAVEALLRQVSEDAFQAQQGDAVREIPSITIPGLTASLRSDDFLVTMGPLIALAYLVFYLNWRRLERATLTASAPSDAVSEILFDGFPRFGSPRDPLAEKSIETGLAAWSARALWFSVLATPIGALVMLVIVRGDMVALVDTSMEDQWLERLLHVRGDDAFSLSVDTVNLGALWLALACMLEIVAPRHNLSRSHRLRNHVAVGVLTVIFVFVWGLRAYDVRTHRYVLWHGLAGLRIEWALVLFLCFGLLWCWALAQALDRKSAANRAVALMGLVLAFGLLI